MDTRLSQLNNFAIAAMLLAAPLLMGGRHPYGRLGVATLAIVMGCGLVARWTLNRESRWLPASIGPLLGAAAVLLVGLQLAPLPKPLLARVAPGLSELLPMWSSGPIGAWKTISMHPDSTQGALAMAAAYALFFFVATQQIASRDDVERWIQWIGVAGIGMAVLGILQYLSETDKYLWVYEHPVRAPQGATTGPFANRNHFAHFIVLALGPILYRLCTASTRDSARHPRLATVAWAAGLTICLLAVFLSRSRGGMIACGLALGTAAIYLAASGWVTRRTAIAASFIGLLLVAALAIHGGPSIKQRLQQAAKARSLADFSAERADLWSAHLTAFPGSPWFGYGAASHLPVHRTFMPRHYDVQFTHGESGYMQLLLETGASGLGLLALAFIAVAYWLFRATRDPKVRGLAAAVAPSIVASVSQSIGDFVWYIPACLTLTLLLVVCLARASSLAEPAAIRWQSLVVGDAAETPRPGGPKRFAKPLTLVPYATAAIATLVAIGTFPALIPDAKAAAAFDQARRLARVNASSETETRLLNQALYRQVAWITQVDPRAAHPHVQLAQCLIAEANWRRAQAEKPPAFQANIFDGLTPSQIRMRLDSEYELIAAATMHIRSAIACGPLEGEAYALWSDLRHLAGPPPASTEPASTEPASTEQWLAQAAKVRPHNGAILLRRGQQFAMRGEMQEAITAWSTAFREHPRYRGLLVERLWNVLPQPVLLEIFRPDASGLLSIYYQLNQMGKYPSAKKIAPITASALAEEARTTEDDKRAGERLNIASRLAAEGGDVEKAIEYAKSSQQRNGAEVPMRLWLAELFEKQQRYGEAAEQLKWVLRRKPRDQTLLQRLVEVRKAEANANSTELR